MEDKLHIDERVNPVAQQPRKIPFHICQKVEAELHELEKGIIEHVYDPTPKKNGEVCICVDMRAVNQAITRK